MVMPLVISSTVLFFVGVAFCFFIVIPALTRFIVAVAPSSINTAPDIEQYFGTVLTLFLVFGIAFEVPVAVVVLARIGIVSIEQLKKFRGYFVVVAFIASAIVTPPDVVSQLSLAIPLCLLYEVGIWSAKVFIRATKAPDEKETAAAKES
jgi:sec-independent protein translocase protein TatC